MPQWLKTFRYRELRIRLARFGYKVHLAVSNEHHSKGPGPMKHLPLSQHHPFYRLYVAKHYQKRQAMPVDQVGTYNPVPEKDGNKHLRLNFDR